MVSIRILNFLCKKTTTNAELIAPSNYWVVIKNFWGKWYSKELAFNDRFTAYIQFAYFIGLSQKYIFLKLCILGNLKSFVAGQIFQKYYFKKMFTLPHNFVEICMVLHNITLHLIVHMLKKLLYIFYISYFRFVKLYSRTDYTRCSNKGAALVVQPYANMSSHPCASVMILS